MRKQEDASRVVESTYKHFGRIDILVNAAAGNFLVAAEDLSPNGFRTGSVFVRCSTLIFFFPQCENFISKVVRFISCITLEESVERWTESSRNKRDSN